MKEFADANDETQKAMLFDAIMNLLTDAIANDDPVFIKSYARLATELWNSYEQSDNLSES